MCTGPTTGQPGHQLTLQWGLGVEALEQTEDVTVHRYTTLT